MKYLEFTFRTVPCTEIVNDVLSGVLGEAGFESFVEQTDGITAYIQKELYNESLLKEALADFPLPDTQIEYNFIEAETKTGTRNGRRTSSSPSLSETVVSFTALFTTMSHKQNMTSSSIRKWHSAQGTTRQQASS